MLLEDYGELMYLQTVLKKTSFDVQAIQNPHLFNDSLLTMNPELIVMTAYGKRIKGLELSRNIKRNRGMPKIILLHGPGQVAEPDPGVDAWLHSPLAANELLDCIGDLCGIDKASLTEKFIKHHLQDVPAAADDQARILKAQFEVGPVVDKSAKAEPKATGVLTPSTMTDEERQNRYKKFLEEKPPQQHGFSIKEVQSAVKALRTEEKSEASEDLEKERRAFVEQLFKKKT